MQRHGGLDLRPSLVSRPGPCAFRFPPGPLALAASTEQLLLHVSLPLAPPSSLGHIELVAIPSVNGKLISSI
jgi:hypothetical protein